MVNGGRRTADGDGGSAALACSPPAAHSLPRGAPSWSQPTAQARGLARALLAVTAAVAFTGCGNIEPWVKPYERQQLADPIMSFDPHPVSTSYMHHVFEAREGARGALGSAGGGCGCN
jgi:hypothetical protein